jgi:hypothetical protein
MRRFEADVGTACIEDPSNTGSTVLSSTVLMKRCTITVADACYERELSG